MKNIFIGIDRDGTLVYDKEYYLGSQKNWKKLLKFLPYVLKGIKMLNKKLPNSALYILTNQPGIAVKELPLLTMKRAEEVCKEIIKRIKMNKVLISGYKICGHASKEYQLKKKEIFTFDKKYSCRCKCMKPSPNMINQAIKDLGWKKEETKIYMIGDRATDILTGINAGGIAIYIPFINTKNTKEIKKIQKKKFYTAKNFLDAVNYIIRKEGLIKN